MDRDAAALLLSLLIGTFGFALLTYGRKQQRLPHVVGGLALIAYPYFIDSPWVMFGIASAIMGVVATAVRLGL